MKLIEDLRNIAEYDCSEDEKCSNCPLCILDACISAEIKIRLNELGMLKEE